MFGMKKKKEEGPAPFSFKDLFSDSQQERATMAKDQIAALLNTTPEALAAFEASYQRDILNNTTENGHFFEVSAKQAAETIPPWIPPRQPKRSTIVLSRNLSRRRRYWTMTARNCNIWTRRICWETTTNA